jgi:AmmeMemoRadiSam system protein A
MNSQEESRTGNTGLPERLQEPVLEWIRQILAAKLSGGQAPPPPDGLEGLRGGVFITLKSGGNLRGCIGRFEFTAPLASAIRDMSLMAAFQDPRFPPLREGELSGLELTVSVLTEPKPLDSLDDLVIGRDGLYLLHPQGRGVLLPVVAEEYGWTPLDFARHTAVKAGLHPEAWRDPGARLLVFTAPAFSSGSRGR